jgi:hypothetical protein
MPDPRVLQPSTLEFYQRPQYPEFFRHKPPPPGGYPRRDTPEALEKSLNDSFDRMRIQVKTNDLLRRDFAESAKIIKAQGKQIRWLKYTLVPSLLAIILELIRH